MAREDTTFDKLSKEEHIAISKKGGRASGAARRRKKSMREWAEIILNSRECDEGRLGAWQAGEIGEEMTKMASIVLHLCNMAAGEGKDSIAAFREIRSLLGEEAPAAVDAALRPGLKEQTARILAVMDRESKHRARSEKEALE